MHSITTTSEPQYLFGYGSLISRSSRSRTISPAALEQTESETAIDAIPVIVSGFQRSWSFKCVRRNYTAVSVGRKEGGRANGVLIKLPDPVNDLAELDAREYNYARGLVPLNDIHCLPLNTMRQDIESNAIVWVYENHSELNFNHNPISSISSATMQQQQNLQTPFHEPSQSFPIPQSYIDCILSGCLFYGEDFARDFVRSTQGWDIKSYLNDRAIENCQRKYSNEQEAYFCKTTIDSLLSEVLVCSRASRQYSSSRL